MHSLQMKTPEPAISRLPPCPCALPQKAQRGGRLGGAAAEELRGGRGGGASVGGGARRADVLHGGGDRERSSHLAARAVDVERDLLVRGFRLEEEALRDHQVGGLVVDWRA